MDLLPTFAEIVGGKIPAGRGMDGISIRGVLLNGEKLPPRRIFFGGGGAFRRLATRRRGHAVECARSAGILRVGEVGRRWEPVGVRGELVGSGVGLDVAGPASDGRFKALAPFVRD